MSVNKVGWCIDCHCDILDYNSKCINCGSLNILYSLSLIKIKDSISCSCGSGSFDCISRMDESSIYTTIYECLNCNEVFTAQDNKKMEGLVG